MLQDAPLEVRVTRKQGEAEDICSLELASLSGDALPPFAAGAHIDVHVGGLVRQYSLCNNPAERHRYLIAVLREPQSRGGSTAIHDHVQVGQTLRISAPRNLFPLAPAAPHSLLLAAGVGVTPILCMAERLSHAGQAFDMHYCARSRSRMAFRERMASSPFAGSVQFHADDEVQAQPASRFDLPAVLAAAPAGTHLYACGPAGFLAHVLDTARARGWPEERLHHEFFAAPAARPAMAAGAFEVCVASTGQTAVVGPDETVVDALARLGVAVQTSCGQGVCGTCLTRVLAGVPDHRDMVLTPGEQALNDQFTPCCSRALSGSLTLDL
ncbi:MAG: PDR/VanB family oxidoreductase [Polaromonas sp.]|nr:PDR/VanB family oxidoreductase [Polaromonas sp.]